MSTAVVAGEVEIPPVGIAGSALVVTSEIAAVTVTVTVWSSQGGRLEGVVLILEAEATPVALGRAAPGGAEASEPSKEKDWFGSVESQVATSTTLPFTTKQVPA